MGKPAWNRGLKIYTDKTYSEKEKIKFRQSVLNKPVAQYTVEGALIRVYQSQRDAARITGYRREGIKDCCNGRQLSAYGFIWKKIDKDKFEGLKKTYPWIKGQVDSRRLSMV